MEQLQTFENLAPSEPIALAIDRTLARALAENCATDQRLAFARSFTYATARTLCASLAPAATFPELSRSVPLLPLTAQAKRAADDLGASIARAPRAEAIYMLGCIYTSTLPAEFRARHGIFYTPPEAARHTLDMAERAGVDFKRARCLDPSAGGGAFLVELLNRLRAALAGTDPALVLSQIATRVRGYDLDPFGAWLAQLAAHVAVNDLEATAGRVLPSIVKLRDSLDIDPDDVAAFDLVCSNVPFGKVSLSPERRALYARSTYGHANLYGLFIDAGVSYAKAHGVVAYITPTSMLSGLYFRALRAFLAKSAPPHEVTFITERAGVFEDALQETMLVTFRRGRRNRTGKVSFTAIDGEGASTIAGSFTLPDDPHAPWLLPRTADQADLAARLRQMPHRLADYGYSVSTGPLVWNRFKPQLRDSKLANALPIIWAEAVTSNGRFVWRAERRNHAPWFLPAFPRDNWLVVDHACVLLQRTTAKEQDRRLIAAELPESFVAKHGGVIIENHLNMIRAASGEATISPAVIAAVLNSRAADAAFRCISGSVAVSAFELEELPLPCPVTMRKIEALISRGAKSKVIEQTIAKSYGVL